MALLSASVMVMVVCFESCAVAWTRRGAMVSAEQARIERAMRAHC